MREIQVKYRSHDKNVVILQKFRFTDDAAKQLAEELNSYEGGPVKENSMIFYLLSACTCLSKIENFGRLLDFDVEVPDLVDLVDTYQA